LEAEQGKADAKKAEEEKKADKTLDELRDELKESKDTLKTLSSTTDVLLSKLAQQALS